MTVNITLSANPVAEAEREKLLQSPIFGTIFTDHMITATWTRDGGWQQPELGPRKPFQMNPENAAFHYGQQLFEGMKAYRGADGSIRLFRPAENAARMNRSARRMAMPEVPPELFLDSVRTLVSVERGWIPAEGSLYLRPFMFADESFLGVRPANRCTFCVIASPAADYFRAGAKGLTVWVENETSRAAPGGTGAAKCGGNYAGSLMAQSRASSEGCDQVLFLSACGNRQIEELGGMNIFFVRKDGRVQTPPLGTILPGITRASVIELLKADGITVEEVPYTFDALQADVEAGEISEVFVCGTAAIIASVSRLKHSDGELEIGQPGETARRLRTTLQGIYTGDIAGPDGWSVIVEPEAVLG
ncbi:branched-chain amino acid aminotransferase [Paracoccus caeni]|uniref:Branched-chain-amino-acid aminotransferase n=1 Tax=Paracoccus caeni TaxID=657651 RepID=A0A934SIG1_9RHOB|nr:branched-chain amino acid aminotransferase [Paracoccus caeni]MBK4217691.1 branched-chain amino acid aminotransferase [Paracoccus caeni]